MRTILWVVLALLCDVCLWNASARAGQERSAGESPSLDDMTIEEMRAFQRYAYVSGGRDPLTVLLPVIQEPTVEKTPPPRPVPSSDTSPVAAPKPPAVKEQETLLAAWLVRIMDSILQRRYDAALQTAGEAIHRIDNEWPPLHPEPTTLTERVEKIREYYSLAFFMKNRQDTAAEFKALELTVECTVSSSADPKALVNGIPRIPGDILVDVRKEGDLRVEQIEGDGIIFQYKDMRFWKPKATTPSGTPCPDE